MPEAETKIVLNAASTVIIGHVDAGKSSTSGRLMIDCGALDQRKFEKLKKEAEANNRGTFALAYATDENPEEKKRGITIVANTKEFILPESGKRITLVDAPGHRDFINNMITGASQCNTAILVVSAVNTEYVAGIAPSGQTLEHLLLINALGVSKIIVAVNKMDAGSVNWSKDQFETIRAEICRIYRKVGGKLPKNYESMLDDTEKEKTLNIRFVPISAVNGKNTLTVDSSVTPWYKQASLIGKMNDWPPIEYDLTVPLRMSVTGLCKVSGAGQVVTGKIHSGVMKVGDKIQSVPNEFTALVKSIEKFHRNSPDAFPGDNIGIALKGKSDDKVLSKKGDIIGKFDSGLIPVKRFSGRCVITGKIKNDIAVGFKPVISTGTARCATILADITSIKGKGSKEEQIEIRKTIKSGDNFVGDFQPEKSIAIECDKKYGLLTRFVVRNSNTTIGIGQCLKIDNDKFDKDCAIKIKNAGGTGKAAEKKAKGKKKK